MPRIYAQHEGHTFDMGVVEFINGAAAAAVGFDIDYFTAERGYSIDRSKHNLELWDKMPIAELDELYTYLGGTVVSTDTKAEKVRKIEGNISTKYIAALTVASAAATAGTGKTEITITSPGTAEYWFKSAKTTAPALLYGDVPGTGAGWQKLTLVSGVADEIAPNAATDDKYTVVRVTSGGSVDATGGGTLTLKS